MSGCPSTVRGGLKLLSFGSAHSWNLTGSSGHPPALGGGVPCAKVRSAAPARTTIAAAQAGMSDGFIGDLRQSVRMKTNWRPSYAGIRRSGSGRVHSDSSQYGTEHDALGGLLDRCATLLRADRDRSSRTPHRFEKVLVTGQAPSRALHTARRDGHDGRGLPRAAKGYRTLSRRLAPLSVFHADPIQH